MAERALFHDGLPSAPGLEVEVHRGFLVDADEQFPALLEETPWSRDAIVVFGQKRPIPRMEAWYGDAGRTYRYSGRRLEPLPWTSRLAELRPVRHNRRRGLRLRTREPLPKRRRRRRLALGRRIGTGEPPGHRLTVSRRHATLSPPT